VNDLTKNILVFIVIIVVLLSVVQGLSGVSGGQPMLVDYSDFVEQVESGQVSIVEFDGDRIRFGNREPFQYHAINPETDNNTLIGRLEKNNVHFRAAEPKQQSLIGQLLISSAGWRRRPGSDVLRQEQGSSSG
jgi:cell division protease FtsH